jgi:hypothetical protein
LPHFVRQFGGVGIVNGHTLRTRAGLIPPERLAPVHLARLSQILLHRAQTLDERGFGSGADYQRSA